MGWPVDEFHDDVGEKAGWSLNSGVGLFLNCHFKRMDWQNSLKSLLNSGSLFWIGAKLSSFSSILMSVSLSTLLIKLNTVSDTNLQVSLHCSVHSLTILWSAVHYNSSRMFKISSSCVCNEKSGDAHVLLILLLLALWEVDVAVLTTGVGNIPKELIC